RYHSVDVRQHRDLGQEFGTDHVRRQLVLVVLRSHADDVAVRGVGEGRYQSLHQSDVSRPERAKADVDQRPLALGWSPRVIGGSDTGLDVVPGRPQRTAAAIVELARIQHQVEEG